MDFILSEEQQMLADTVGRLLERNADFGTRRTLAASDLGYSQENWRALANLGLLGLHVPEAYGGLNGTAVDALIVMEACGRHLMLEPFFSTAIVGASLIADVASESIKKVLLPGVASGQMKLGLATLEPDARYDLWDIRTRATRDSDGYVINGAKAVVLDGADADFLIVSARTSGDVTERDGITLFLIEALSAGVTVKGYPNIDGTRSAEIAFENVRVHTDALLGEQDAGYPVLERAVDRGLASLCAEAVGCMSRLVDLSVAHLSTRKQFGQVLGRFQALQHQVAEMLIATEQARAMAFYVAAKIDEPDDRERRKAASAAKAVIGRCARFVGEHAVQLHGGMGMTDELAVGNYFKRLNCIDMTWGNVEHHTELYGDFL